MRNIFSKIKEAIHIGNMEDYLLDNKDAEQFAVRAYVRNNW